GYEDFLSNCLNDLEEIENIIEVNLESAVEIEDKEQEENPQKIANEALGRLLTKVEDLQSRTQQKWSDIESVIRDGVQKFNESLLSLLHEGDTQTLQFINAKYRVQETTKGWQDMLDSRWARTQDRLALWGRFSWQKSKKYVNEARKIAGFEEEKVTESHRADIATYLSETDQKLKELPYIYRRLFNFDAEADERFYVAVSDSAIQLEKAYEQWKESYPSTVAVVGEKGSGKSTFLNLAAESHFSEVHSVQIILRDTIWSEDVVVELLAEKLEITGAANMNDIVEAIKKNDRRRVVILEGIQNCFIRNVNGYDAIEKLSYLISETKEQVFWVVSCSRYAWRFLDKIENTSEYFSHIIRTDTLDAAQIEKVVMNRHRASGYSLQFEAGDSILRSRSYRKLESEEDAKELLRKNYFTKLAELGEGNASIAMIFWIRSISEFDDTCFYIRPLEITSIEMIEDLSPPVLFTLAAFVMHDTVADADLSMILNLSKEESRLMLIRLHSRGLLVKTNGYYILNHLMYRQIVRVLKERNIIHLV
ncbi:MAG TPA: ATP-binding protein, partial [Balneolaceae bacterium]|nr:ATP-binding protein [Balneolaceae bacterium]